MSDNAVDEKNRTLMYVLAAGGLLFFCIVSCAVVAIAIFLLTEQDETDTATVNDREIDSPMTEESEADILMPEKSETDIPMTEESEANALTAMNGVYAGIPLGGQFADARDIKRAMDVAEGVERGIDESGIPYIGNPEAPIIIGIFTNYTCSHCATYAVTIEPVIQNYVRSGQVKLEMLVLSNSEESTYGARAAYCAAEQGGFWEMHDEIFRIARSGSYNLLSPDGMQETAYNLGLDGAMLQSCMNSERPDNTIAAARQQATEVMVSGTPTVVYRYAGEEDWRVFGSESDGSAAGGGQPYDTLAQLIESAN